MQLNSDVKPEVRNKSFRIRTDPREEVREDVDVYDSFRCSDRIVIRSREDGDKMSKPWDVLTSVEPVRSMRT